MENNNQENETNTIKQFMRLMIKQKRSQTLEEMLFYHSLVELLVVQLY